MIQPGLERIAQLLKGVKISWKSVHVAGTNGKGSICHNVLALLRSRGLRVGRFTSPHLIDRWDCIWANGKVIEERTFKKIEDYYRKLSDKNEIKASSFEVLTATAFHYFNEEKLDIGVIEVGMGGKLDATNILENQIVSVVSKIAMDHEGFLGSTLEEIAKHKAGILRQNVPYAISPANDDDVQKVIGGYAKEIGAGPRITVDSTAAFSNLSEWQDLTKDWVQSQKDNAALAVFATNKALQKFDLAVMEPKTILSELSRPLSATYPGRLQYHHASSIFPPSTDSSRAILIDGAHNPDAAKSLNAFVEKHERRKLSTVTSHRNGWPVTWILAMTNGKDASNFLNILLRPGDRVVTTGFGPVDGMPWVKSMPAAELLEAARTAQPKIEGVAMQEPGALKALFLAKDITYAAEMGELLPEHRPIVLTGSLYFVADYLREVRTAVVSMENT